MNRLLPVFVHIPQDTAAQDGGRGEQGRDGKGGARASRLLASTAGAYAAQIIGQGGQKRGLRGGAPVLEAARSAYLGAEYSGENDRRPPSGLIMRRAV